MEDQPPLALKPPMEDPSLFGWLLCPPPHSRYLPPNRMPTNSENRAYAQPSVLSFLGGGKTPKYFILATSYIPLSEVVHLTEGRSQ